MKHEEQLHADHYPAHPLLRSVPGYRYCLLLPDRGDREEFLRRATISLAISEQNQRLQETGLDHLLLGRAHPKGSRDSVRHLDRAVQYLRLAGRLDYLPLALLARGTTRVLEEVFRIASRSGMRLYLAEYHLSSARLAIDNQERSKAFDDLAKAEALVNETEYHRRDLDILQLRTALADRV